MAIMHIRLEGEWVAVPLPDQVREGVVFHYTGPQGLIGIVESDELWASSALALNDTSEVSYGLDVLHEATEHRRDVPALHLRRLVENDEFLELREFAYFVSASEFDDSLTQWTTYAGRQGYSIGIETRVRLAAKLRGTAERPPAETPMTTRGAPLRGTFGWYRVVYERAAQVDAVVRLLDFCVEHGLLDETEVGMAHALTMFGILLPQFKHPAFRDEREIRFIAGRIDGTEDGFTPGRFGVVPRLSLIPAGDGDREGALPTGQKLPIRSVTIGPTDRDERALAISATKRLLSSAGYGSSAVGASQTPYRF